MRRATASAEGRRGRAGAGSWRERARTASDVGASGSLAGVDAAAGAMGVAFAAAFFAGVFWAVVFLAPAPWAVALLAPVFWAPVFWAPAFFAVDFFDAAFFAVAFFVVPSGELFLAAFAGVVFLAGCVFLAALLLEADFLAAAAACFLAAGRPERASGVSDNAGLLAVDSSLTGSAFCRGSAGSDSFR